MLETDISAVLAVQRECYGSAMQEEESAIRARLRSSPDTAWVVEDEVGVCAYLVAYRSCVGKVTALGGRFDIPLQPDSLYLHDLAIGNRGKSLGLSSALIECAWTHARAENLGYSSLVSVQNSRAFWQRYGYADYVLDSAQAAILHTYDGAAWYMVKSLRDIN